MKNLYIFSGHYYVEVYANDVVEAEASFDEIIQSIPNDIEFGEDYGIYSPDVPIRREYD